MRRRPRVERISRLRASLQPAAAFVTAIVVGCSQGTLPEDPAEKLRALPYVGVAPVRGDDLGKLGVQIHERDAASFGINVDCSEKREGARLFDMDGKALHEILGSRCKLIEPYDERTFILLGYPTGLMRVDWHSNVVWINDQGFHHDFAVASDGAIWAVANRLADLPYRDTNLEVLDNEVFILDEDGKARDSFSLLEALTPVFPREPLERLYEATRNEDFSPLAVGYKPSDVMHVNTLELLAEDGPLGPRGALMICARHANLIAVLADRGRRVTWSYGPGELDMPHQPTLMPNGNLLIFDNGSERGWSRIIELEPQTKEIVWQYRSDEPLFYSQSRGSVQPLPNGNVLVGESDRGRWFEVTRGGRVVWDYWAPESRGADGSFQRTTLYRAARWTPDVVQNPAFLDLWGEQFAGDGPPRR